MKAKHSDLTIRYLAIFKIDAQNLFDRIVKRAHESIESFSLKRNRAIFKEVFDNRYQQASAKDLSYCPLEVIEVLNTFYTEVDELYWYLKTTQDMPNTIEDEVTRRVSKLDNHHRNLLLFIDAELSGKSISELPPSNIHDLEFTLEGERSAELKKEDYILDDQEDITTEV